MIIDVILDAKYEALNKPLTDKEAMDILEEAALFKFDYIVAAFDSLNNSEVQKALCRYIDDQGYNPEIKKFIISKTWVTENEPEGIPQEFINGMLFAAALIEDREARSQMSKGYKATKKQTEINRITREAVSGSSDFIKCIAKKGSLIRWLEEYSAGKLWQL